MTKEDVVRVSELRKKILISKKDKKKLERLLDKHKKKIANTTALQK